MTEIIFSKNIIISFFAILSGLLFYFFVRKKSRNPALLFLAAWSAAVGISHFKLSSIEKSWTAQYWVLLLASVGAFILFFKLFELFWEKRKQVFETAFFKLGSTNFKNLRIVNFLLFFFSLVGLFLFYIKAGNFPLLAASSDEFRFWADEKVPGLINYTAQMGRIFVPLVFYYFLFEKFSIKKHWPEICILSVGVISLLLFASRTQIFFIDLWIMALYLVVKKPKFKQAVRFYPVFLLVSILVLAAIPLVRQQRSYGADYLSTITGIDTSRLPKPVKYMVPIYVGVSFNQQALLHATEYYKTHEIQKGKVTLDPFTNILKIKSLKSEYDLGQIFKPWWNTGTYLFPFVQDFGKAGYFVAPFLLAFFLAFVWKYFNARANFFAVQLYAYSCFFVVMSVYLSFTVRAEMYLDLFLLSIIYLTVSRRQSVFHINK